MAAKKKSVTKLKRRPKAKKSENDIVELILKDHKPLKKLIKILKSEKGIEEKRPAFEEFAPLLIAHAKPEEESLYVRMKDVEKLREVAFEGDTEHEIADRLVEEIKALKDEDVWMAKVKVLAEVVEHHIEEEEGEMLPDVKKEMGLEQREKIGQEYLRLREDFSSEGFEGGDDARLAS